MFILKGMPSDYAAHFKEYAMSLLSHLSKPKKEEYTPNPEWERLQRFTPCPKSKMLEMAEMALVQVQDSTKLVNETKNPEVFFFRYDFLIGRLEFLSQLEGRIHFSGDSPRKVVAELRTASKRLAVVNDFLERYFNSAKLKVKSLKTKTAKERNVQKYIKELEEYYPYMYPESIEVARNKCIELSNLIY